MKLSLNWLGQYVDLSTSAPEDVAYKLTMATAEVEDVETVNRVIKGIIVGEIIEIEPIETDADDYTMNYVTVNLGSETLKTVCGAPNVTIGMKSAFAPPGTAIANGVTIRKQEVYDRISYGILCSPRELGWGESHAGILAFPEKMTPGAKLADYVPERDYVINVDNKSITHRPDLWGHYGFARELAALYKRELKPLEFADSSEWEMFKPIPLTIEDSEGCPGYCCLDIGGLTPAFSHLDIQYRLLAVGLRPINLLVDLTNYIMCEIGQPMHAFDGERVQNIIVAPFGKDGIFKTLDGIERHMVPDDLMIKDDVSPIAIAGIMGGEDSEIRDDTSRLLLESANFNPARIRRTSVRLGLRSDASLRFEKGQPQYHMALSIKRFIQLLRDAGSKPAINSQLTCGGDMGETPRTMVMKTEYISQTIGMDISPAKNCEILESLGFGCTIENNEIHLAIPPYRSARDISIPNDIVEEVARIYGYDNIVPAMPEGEIRQYTFNSTLQKQHKIQRFLSLAKGYNEAHTYSWYDDTWLKRIKYVPGETLKLQNPTSVNNTRMRREILPNLFQLIETNATHRDRFFLYEAGNVFTPVGNECEQVMNLAGIGYQSEKLGNIQELFLLVKGTVEEIFVLLDTGTPVFTVSKSSHKPWCLPGACMDITIDGRCIGQIGYIIGGQLKVFEKDVQIAWFEFNVGILKGHSYPEITYDTIPVYPGSWMDFSILADKTSSYVELGKTLEHFSHPILMKNKFLYYYSGKGLPEGKVSYTFRFWLGLRERTLTGDDLSDFRSSFLSCLEDHGLVLR